MNFMVVLFHGSFVFLYKIHINLYSIQGNLYKIEGNSSIGQFADHKCGHSQCNLINCNVSQLFKHIKFLFNKTQQPFYIT